MKHDHAKNDKINSFIDLGDKRSDIYFELICDTANNTNTEIGKTYTLYTSLWFQFRATFRYKEFYFQCQKLYYSHLPNQLILSFPKATKLVRKLHVKHKKHFAFFSSIDGKINKNIHFHTLQF